MTTNLRPVSIYLLRTPDGFIHNINSGPDIDTHHTCDDMAAFRPNEKCAHGFQVLYNTRGPWIVTYTGRRYYFLDPHQSEIVIEDIAHALSNICRYNGHCRTFYSVAEHCVRVTAAVATDLGQSDVSEETVLSWSLFALLHDAHEAYVGDMVHPQKVILAPKKVLNPKSGVAYDVRVDQKDLESIADQIIYPKFCGSMPTKEVKDLIKHYDISLLKHEVRALIVNPESQWEEWSNLPDEDGLSPIEPWSPSEAKARFLHAFAQYRGQS